MASPVYTKLRVATLVQLTNMQSEGECLGGVFSDHCCLPISASIREDFDPCPVLSSARSPVPFIHKLEHSEFALLHTRPLNTPVAVCPGALGSTGLRSAHTYAQDQSSPGPSQRERSYLMCACACVHRPFYRHTCQKGKQKWLPVTSCGEAC